ncbi:hypothetical protein B0H14DRAFT_2643016 [Mycena olivaceomarginata]|nr:hypothetical protein B0H14DRAFT_2643016 [Mycena olivaceomarginata]
MIATLAGLTSIDDIADKSMTIPRQNAMASGRPLKSFNHRPMKLVDGMNQILAVIITRNMTPAFLLGRSSLEPIFGLFLMPIALVQPPQLSQLTHHLSLIMHPRTRDLCAKMTMDALLGSFRTRADFEVTEIAVKGLLSKELTNNLLRGASHSWYSKGRSCFKSGSISASYDGVNYNISFEYRDPWEWITRLLEDNTLGLFMMFNSVRKYYCEGVEQETFCERVIDEPNTADAWDEFDSELPDPDPYPHCFLPLHFCLDEGMECVGKWWRRPNRLYGRYPADPSVRKTAKTLEFAKFKMKVYQRVLKGIFASLQKRSWNGVPLECWDRVVRVFHCAWCTTMSCTAFLTKKSEPSTTATMKAVVDEALHARKKTEKENILKNHGLHGIKDLGMKGVFAKNMREFSRWPGLKHFNQVTAVHFTNGQSLRSLFCLASCKSSPAITPLSIVSARLSSRIDRLRTFIKAYEYWSSRVSDQYGKNFDFFKQHATSHIVEDILRKGTTNHGLTHLGEGFQQEAAEAYKQTNFKKCWPSEAITRIRMAVDNYEKQLQFPEERVSYEQQIKTGGVSGTLCGVTRAFTVTHVSSQHAEAENRAGGVSSS